MSDRHSPLRVRPGVQRLLDGRTGVAAMVQNGRSDVSAATDAHRALSSNLAHDDA